MRGSNANRRLGVLHHLLTFMALMLLATLSLVLGLAIEAPPWGLVTGVGIATAKAVLVLWIFMHMAEQPFRTRLTIGVAVVFVVLLVVLTASDVVTRELVPRAGHPTPSEGFFRR